MNIPEAPTIEEIKNKRSKYEGYYNTLREQQKEIDDYYELCFATGVPKKFTSRMPVTARSWVDAGVRNYTLDNPKSRVYPRKQDDKAREQAGLLSGFYDFWLRKDTPVIKVGTKKVLIRGEGFFKVVMDDTFFGSFEGKPLSTLTPEERKDFEEKRLYHWPLRLVSPDPLNVYPSPSHDGCVPDDVLEVLPITVAEAQAMCKRNGWDWETDKDATAVVEWISYINPYWRFFSIDNYPLLQGDARINLLGFVPYVHFSAGMGQSNWEGKPEYYYRSLLYPLRDMFIMEARMLSWIDNMNSRYAWPRYTFTGNPDLIKQEYPEGVPTDPDKLLIQIPNQMEIGVLEGKDPPAGLFQEYGLIQSQVAPPAVLSGVRMAGVYSGTQQEDLMTSAKHIYREAFKNVEEALGTAMGMGARIIEQVYQAPVSFKNFSSEETKLYRMIKPTDIGGHYDCEVRLLAEPPEATDVRKALGKSLWQAGAISLRSMLISYFDMSESEADDEIAQIVAEQALREPTVRSIVSRDAMERLGMEKAQAEMSEAEQLAAQQAGQWGGNLGVESIPPVPQNPNVTTGAEILTKRGRLQEGMTLPPTPQEQTLGAQV